MSTHSAHGSVPHHWRHGRTFGPPSTAPGRWSFGLLLAFTLLMVAFFAFVGMGVAERGDDSFAQEWPLYLSIGGAAVCALAAALTGIIAVTLRHEKSLIVFFAIAVGLFVALFVAGEFVFPH